MQFFYSATNGSDTGSVVAAVVGNEATANLSDLLPATTYTVYGVVTATNGSTPQSSSTTFTTEGARTDHAAWYELPARTTADATITQTVYPASGSQRNYTMYYDKSTYTAYWVASPNGKAKRPPAHRSAPGGTPKPENGSPPPETSWFDATLRPC